MRRILLSSPETVDNKRGMHAAVSAIALILLCYAPASHAAPAQLASCDASSFAEVLQSAAQSSAARAAWLNRQLILWPGKQPGHTFKLYHSKSASLRASKGQKVSGADGQFSLSISAEPLPQAAAGRYRYLAAGLTFALDAGAQASLAELLQQQIFLVEENAAGEVQDLTSLQTAGVLDDLYAQAATLDDLGARPEARQTRFKLWAPTAQNVALCTYRRGDARASSIRHLQRDATSGAWSGVLKGDLNGQYYQYLVDVYVPGQGLLRNHVTDPYSLSLNTDSKRGYIARLDGAKLKPAGWDQHTAPARVQHQTDMSVYELHVRDFSANDASVRPAYRGKYLAFTEAKSNGMKHLRGLSQAGLTDVHLLPVFDIASVPESGCVTPTPSGAADSEQQQATVTAHAARDCFNWGYDPLHYNAPEGSYASTAGDGARRIVEFRQMVLALHRAGLRVGMDVVYNHTMASGQNAQSVLDRIVPGYYHRLNANGEVEQSTCANCGNTATENLMMAKLMSDSLRLWVREYRIDSFRFDLMGHQPQALMSALRKQLKSIEGRDIQFIGEGWNFGEVANGARFVHASQLSLNGSHIGTFNDRLRDAVRGGGNGDDPAGISKNQGYINGLMYAPNQLADRQRPPSDLMRSADMIRVGMAGSIRDYPMQTWDGRQLAAQDIPYGDQPAAYVSEPEEVVNYVENHDNQTLFDINVLRLPTDTSRADRARVQALGLAITAFSQGIPYFHAGSEILRSKSLDGNSFDSGDWFNRLDWGYHDNNFAVGLPPKQDNGQFYPFIKPLLSNPDIKPGQAEITWTHQVFLDLLKMRHSSSLLRLHSAAEIKKRLQFFNVGPQQNPVVIAARIDGKNYPGAVYDTLAYFINVSPQAQQISIPELSGRKFRLHPVQQSARAADQSVASQARYDGKRGLFLIPPRAAVVFVE